MEAYWKEFIKSNMQWTSYKSLKEMTTGAGRDTFTGLSDL